MSSTSIQNKITKAILITSTAVLLLSGLAYTIYEFTTFRDSTVEKVAVLAKVVSNNSTAALAFDSQSDAYEILSALRAEENVTLAALYDENGELFTSYPKKISKSEFPAQIDLSENHYFKGTYLHDFQPVMHNSKRLGTLYIKYDLSSLTKQYFYLGITALIIFTLSLLLAYFLSSKLRRRISQPIIAIAAMAHNISFYKDYSVRMKKTSDDELGVLTNAFNHMLTQIEQQSEEIQKNEKRFRALADNISQLAWMTDETGAVIWYNKRWFDYTGTTFDEMKGWGWKKIQHPDHINHVESKFFEAVNKGEVWEDTFPIRDKYGNYKWFLSRAVPIHDDQGKIIHWFGTNTDISDIREVEDALRKSEEFSRTLLQSSPDCLIALDLQGRILSINPQGQIMLEIDRIENYIGNHWKTIWSEENLKTVENALKNSKKGNISHFQVFSPTINGTGKWWDVLVAPVYGADKKVERLVSVSRDISKIKELEQQKDDFLSIASHELKTPVTSIKAYTQVLYSIFERTNDKTSTEMLAKMDGQLNKLTVLIADLLDVTRIEQGKLLFRIEEFDFNELVHEIVEEVQRTTTKHQIMEEYGEVGFISADKDRIGQVITNFLSNAIKYSAKSKDIVIRTTKNDNKLILSVQDFGVGLSEEDKLRVFERFYRVSRTGYETFPGLGLGLYISAEIIQRHNGTIWVESERDNGSTFYFSIPI